MINENVLIRLRLWCAGHEQQRPLRTNYQDHKWRCFGRGLPLTHLENKHVKHTKIQTSQRAECKVITQTLLFAVSIAEI